MRLKLIFTIGLLFCVGTIASAQQIQIDRQNRTVDVEVKEGIEVEAEIALVTIGCLSYGDTHDQAYAENLRAADKVLKAILAFGITKEDIASTRLELSENDSDDRNSRNSRQPTPRRYKAHQGWTVRVTAANAQKLIDNVVHAGANGIEEISWAVKDPGALRAKARAKALERAKVVAAELAQSVGGKLGIPLYVSDYVVEMTFVSKSQSDKKDYVDQNGVFETPEFKLQLFPEKIREDITIHVVFALE
jgi:uncharacterized protein